MPKFDAGSTVEPLDWDFTTLKKWPREFPNAKGTITEPSDATIGAFLRDLQGVYEEARKLANLDDVDQEDPVAMMAALSSVSGDEFVTIMARMAEVFSSLCSGHPTKSELLALPLRVRNTFYVWVQEQVVNPEGESGGGSAQVMTLPAARAG